MKKSKNKSEVHPISIKIEKGLWKSARLHCVEKGLTISAWVQELMRKSINKENKNGKAEA